MNLKPKISIVTAYYNRKNLFLNTLKSISASKHVKDIEVVVVDDASDKKHRLEDIVDNYPFPINLIRTELEDKWYVNPCVPFNKAIKAAKADLIMLQNPECYHNGDLLDTALDHTKDDNYITFACYSLNKIQTTLLGSEKKIKIEDNKAVVGGETGWYNHSTINPRPYHFASCITKKNMDALGGFDEEYANGVGFDDNEFVMRVNEQVKGNILIFDTPFVFHQNHYSNKSFEQQANARPELLSRNRDLFINSIREGKYHKYNV